MYLHRHIVAVTTDASGDATEYTPVVRGRIMAIRYVKTDFADTVDFTITSEITGMDIWTEANVTASETVRPHDPVQQSTDGADLTYDGTYKVPAPVVIAEERVKIVVAAGGDTKTGTFHVLVG